MMEINQWKYLTSPAEAEDILAVGGVNVEGKEHPSVPMDPAMMVELNRTQLL